MKIKTIFRAAIMMIMLAILVPAPAARATEVTPVETPENKAARLTQRLEEIKAMDMKSMSRAEKKQLRGEVRAIKKEMKAMSGGVYLSVGAVVLIVLLILLLA